MSYRSLMRGLRLLPVVLAMVGGCITQSSSDPPYDPYNPYDPGWGSGAGGGGGSTGFGCHADTECGTGSVCARDGECLAADQVRVVHVIWTVQGQAASATTCTAAPKLDITFSDAQGYSFGFSPVPCAEGKFTVDKMPTNFSSVALERQYAYDGGAGGVFDATGTATVDLPY